MAAAGQVLHAGTMKQHLLLENREEDTEDMQDKEPLSTQKHVWLKWLKRK